MYSYICIHSTHMHVTANTCYLQICLCCYSVAKSCLILCDPMNCSMPGFQGLHSLRIYTDSCLLSQGCYLSFSSSAAPFSCPQSFPTSRSCLLAKCIYNSKINTHRTSQVKQDNALLSCFCSHAVNKCPCCTLFKCMVFLIFVTFVGDFAGEGDGNPLHCSCLGNHIDGEAWWATLHAVARSQPRLSN